MHIQQFFIEGLGHQSYLVTDGVSGTAVVIDPRRDIDIYLEAATKAGVTITHAFETHLHNDYITGARELKNRYNVQIVTSAEGHVDYADIHVNDEDVVTVGQATFQVWATPGHTLEHVSYLLFNNQEEPMAIFSGGSMLAAGAGRTDLLGEGLTITLSRYQYRSLRRILDSLPDTVTVYPTHGAGSFCSAAVTEEPVHYTTVAQEKIDSPAAQAADEVDFVKKQMAGHIAYPTYYRYMYEINHDGPGLLGDISHVPAMSPKEVHHHLLEGIPLIDGRPREEFAREHVPGSINIEHDSLFGTYIGWILPFNIPMMLNMSAVEEHDDAIRQLIRIGYETTEGYLDGGIPAWKAAEYPTHSYERILLDEFAARWQMGEEFAIVDVRRYDEWLEGHIPGAIHAPVGDIYRHLTTLPIDKTIVVYCKTGHRASMAASIIASTGRTVIAVQGGAPDWVARGLPTDIPAERPAAIAIHAHP